VNVYTAKGLAYGQHTLKHMCVMIAIGKTKRRRRMRIHERDRLTRWNYFTLTCAILYMILIIGNYFK